MKIHTLISRLLLIKSVDQLKQESRRYVLQLQLPQIQVIRVSVRFLEFFLFFILQDGNSEGTEIELHNAASISQ